MKATLKIFLLYILWATFQQALVLTPLLLFMSDNTERSVLGVFLFGLIGHLPNWPLVLLTTCLAICFYPLFFFFDEKIIIGSLLVLSHAGSGSYLKSIGFEMRVWRF